MPTAKLQIIVIGILKPPSAYSGIPAPIAVNTPHDERRRPNAALNPRGGGYASTGTENTSVAGWPARSWILRTASAFGASRCTRPSPSRDRPTRAGNPRPRPPGCRGQPSVRHGVPRASPRASRDGRPASEPVQVMRSCIPASVRRVLGSNATVGGVVDGEPSSSVPAAERLPARSRHWAQTASGPPRPAVSRTRSQARGESAGAAEPQTARQGSPQGSRGDRWARRSMASAAVHA